MRVTPFLAGLRVVALDLRGHGLSEHRDSYRYVDYEHDLAALLDSLGLEDVIVAGHSLGGYVALVAATRDARIRRVVAIDVKSDWTDEDAAFAERARHGSQRVEPDRETLVARLAQSVAPAVLDESELAALAERSLEQVEGGWRFRWDRRVLAPEPVDPFAFLLDVPCPVNVIAGTQSVVMPPERARRFAEAIPSAALDLVEGAGHHAELEAPARIAERIVEAAGSPRESDRARGW